MPNQITQIRENIFKSMEDFSKIIGDVSDKKVLDIGIEGDPYPSGNFVYFKAAKEFKTSDCNPKFKPNFVDDITDSHFPDSYWDIVICSQVIEHVWDFKKAFKHLYRILNTGGTLIIDCPWLWGWHPTNETKDFWRFSPNALTDLLVGCGFKFKNIKIRMSEDQTLISALCLKEDNVNTK